RHSPMSRGTTDRISFLCDFISLLPGFFCRTRIYTRLHCRRASSGRGPVQHCLFLGDFERLRLLQGGSRTAMNFPPHKWQTFVGAATHSARGAVKRESESHYSSSSPRSTEVLPRQLPHFVLPFPQRLDAQPSSGPARSHRSENEEECCLKSAIGLIQASPQGLKCNEGGGIDRFVRPTT